MYQNLFIIYLIIINIISFIFCFIDKRNAIKNKWRIPEITLLLLSLVGGCFGFYIGMRLFHHKTKKIKFEICIPLMIFLWGYIVYRVLD